MQVVKKTHGDKTREKILNAGVKIWPEMSLSKIGRETGLTHAAISYHFPLEQLRDRVAEHAVAIGESRVIVQLIAEKHPAVDHLTAGEKSAHFFTV